MAYEPASDRALRLGCVLRGVAVLTDARLSTTFPAHPKTKKLLRRLGPAGPWALICLFLWARNSKPDGDLTGMTVEDIELAADWAGDDGALVAALSVVGFLDGHDGAFRIHDWAEHQPWSAGAEDRSQASAWAALCKRWGREGAAERMPEYAAKMQAAPKPDAAKVRPACDPHATGMRPAAEPHATPTNPQCPASASVSVSVTKSKSHPIHFVHGIRDLPAEASPENGPDDDDGGEKTQPDPPDPVPLDHPADLLGDPDVGKRRKRTMPNCPAAKIADLWGVVMPDLPQPLLWTDGRRESVSARWKEMAKRYEWKTIDEGLAWFEKTFRYIRTSTFLMGRARTREKDGRPFVLEFDWAFRPTNFRKIVEGKYHRGQVSPG